MQALLSKLPAFALPFVTRSLRGGRGRRYLILSLVLASLTGLVGVWLALGSGSFEQSIRTDLGLEDHEFDRERMAFTVYVHDSHELSTAKRELSALRRGGSGSAPAYYGEAYGLYDYGRAHLEQAAWSPVHGPEQAQLRERARALLGGQFDNQLYADTWDHEFAWYDGREVAMLEAVLDHGGVPDVALYRSPLRARDALRLTGFLAGLLLAGLTTVFAPLLVTVQQAQERHENTLMPLTGTALGARELALGLASGPSFVVAIFAAPQLALFLICSALGGEITVALALIAALATTSALFIFGGQLLGQLMGRRRTPGVIGIAMMAVAGIAWLVGIAIMADADHGMGGFAAVLPHIGLAALLAEVFIEIPVGFSEVFGAIFAWTAASVLLGWLTLTALARRIEGREGPLLGASQAALGALACIVLVGVAIPEETHRPEALRQYIGLVILALPLTLLLMARVPAGDMPPRMRKLPVPALLAEFAAWGAAHMILSGLAFGFDVHALHPVALAWLGWCVLVLGLIAVRIVAVPTKIAANVWAAFCAFSLILGFAQALYWGLENGHRNFEDVFVMTQLSPVLGLLQIGLTVWIPLSLIRHLRKNLGAIS